MDAQRKGYLFAFLASITASFNYIFSKYALQYLEPLIFCIFWFAAGSVYSLAYVLLKTRGRGLRLRRSIVPPTAAVGLFSAISVIGIFTAIKLLDPTVAAFFARMDLAFVLLIAVVFLGERFNVREGAGVAIAGIGILIINWQSTPVVWAGFSWMMLGCAAFAVYSAISKQHIREIRPEILTFYRAFLVTLFLGAYAAGTGQFEQLINANTRGVLAAVLGTFFGPFLNHLLIFKSIRLVEVSKCMVVRQGTPVFVAIASFTILEMHPTLEQVIGGLLIILGILVLILAGRPRKLEAETSP